MVKNEEFIQSWITEDGVDNTLEALLSWIEDLNRTTYVNIRECSIYESDFWFYDDYKGEILNRKRSFFSIIGMRYFEDGKFVGEQPIIVQPEIGYLGIICKKINGVLHFLMQAKIEPGNANCVQISPTIQATKSNFMRAHGGRLPAYFEYFENSGNYEVIYDQVQSEQSSRFYKKRNRNMIMYLEEDIEVYPNFKWMTLGQIKYLMKIDNLVNMDTRTVLSGLPFYCLDEGVSNIRQLQDIFRDIPLFVSMFLKEAKMELPILFKKLNDYKMFKDVTVSSVPLNQLVEWKTDEYGIVCKTPADFSVHYYDIEISGREVQKWTQPLFKASGSATLALITKIEDGVKRFLVQVKAEIGSFDKVEFGPSVQWEPTHSAALDDPVDRCLRNHLRDGEGISLNVLLSEEGGRFYHEQNRNIILNIELDELPVVPSEYLWVNFSTLNYMVQVHNCLNIQLRNLLSLIDL